MLVLRVRTVFFKTTDEMTPEEFKVFRRGWYRHAVRLSLKQGMSMADARERAKVEFLSLKRNGFSARNAVQLQRRQRRQEVVKQAYNERIKRCGK